MFNLKGFVKVSCCKLRQFGQNNDYFSQRGSINRDELYNRSAGKAFFNLAKLANVLLPAGLQSGLYRQAIVPFLVQRPKSFPAYHKEGPFCHMIS